MLNTINKDSVKKPLETAENAKKHKDRYRTVFCDQSFYIQHQSSFVILKQTFQHLGLANKLTAWVVCLSALRRHDDWYSGKNLKVIDVELGTHPLPVSSVFKSIGIEWNKKIPSDIDFNGFINQYKIKALPNSVFISLVNLLLHKYPLEITNDVPTPEKLLEYQVANKRIVSFNEDFETWPEVLYNERDYLGFVIHDLIHAYHFFNDTTHRLGQLGFYRLIEKIMLHTRMTELRCDENFKNGFEYIISDMNSHPLHLFKTLHSLVFSTYKNDALAIQTWSSWLSMFGLTLKENQALMLVNADGFGPLHAQTVQDLCVRMGL